MQQVIQRPDDYIFRMGGEEFTIIFCTKDEDEAIRLARKIVKQIEDLQIEHKSNPPYHVVTVSAGLVINTRHNIEINEGIIEKREDAKNIIHILHDHTWYPGSLFQQ